MPALLLEPPWLVTAASTPVYHEGEVYLVLTLTHVRWPATIQAPVKLERKDVRHDATPS